MCIIFGDVLNLATLANGHPTAKFKVRQYYFCTERDTAAGLQLRWLFHNSGKFYLNAPSP